MPTGFVQLPVDSTGKKLETRTRTDPVHGELHAQATWQKAAETWVATADAVAFAQNKHHLSVWNAAGSGRVVKLRKLFAVNVQLLAISGAAMRFNVHRVTGSSAGTTVTPQTMDSQNAALPAGVQVRTNGSVTGPVLLFPWVTSTDEETAVPALSKAMFQQATNILMEGTEVQELTLREGEGVSVQQVTASTAGSYAWIVVFTVEQP